MSDQQIPQRSVNLQPVPVISYATDIAVLRDGTQAVSLQLVVPGGLTLVQLTPDQAKIIGNALCQSSDKARLVLPPHPNGFKPKGR